MENNKRITFQDVESLIKQKSFHCISDKTIICLLELHNGMEVVGYSHVQHKDFFDLDIGQITAYNNAINVLFPIAIAIILTKKGI